MRNRNRGSEYESSLETKPGRVSRIAPEAGVSVEVHNAIAGVDSGLFSDRGKETGKRRLGTSSVSHSEREMSHTYSDLGSGARHLDCHLRP